LVEARELLDEGDLGTAKLMLRDVVQTTVGFECSLLPVMIKATLIPFEGQITYDSLFTSYPISFGRGIAASLNRDYHNAKKRGAIIDSLNRPTLTLVR
jgi:hypothetical protein